MPRIEMENLPSTTMIIAAVILGFLLGNIIFQQENQTNSYLSYHALVLASPINEVSIL